MLLKDTSNDLRLAWNLYIQPDSFQADNLILCDLLGLFNAAREVDSIPVETSELVAGVVGVIHYR